MWKGRFSEQTAELVVKYTESISYDRRLYAYDIAGSIAHARAQVGAGTLSPDEFELIEAGLLSIKESIEAGEFTWSKELEDVHMNIESELTKRIGPVGAKLHAARSRNDQVATDTRLYTREACEVILDEIRNLQTALVEKATEYQDVVMPGYTHLQRGQPVSMAHHLLAYVEMLDRDAQRLEQAKTRLNVSPLGSGALAGSTICLDREQVAHELGFDSVSQNSMDAIADRDYILEVLFDISLIGAHLSRLSEDLILWSSAEFGFVVLADAHTTGSSLMPQKKNPDIAEITRGKTGRLYGSLISVLTAVKGLPLTYNRDLQEDKEPLFDAVDTIVMALAVNAEQMRGMTVMKERCLIAASDSMLLATDLADYLVREGVAFRDAHEIVGSAVAIAIEQGVELSSLPQSTWAELHPVLDRDLSFIFNLKAALEARDNPGAPAPKQVAIQLARWQEVLSE